MVKKTPIYANNMFITIALRINTIIVQQKAHFLLKDIAKKRFHHYT